MATTIVTGYVYLTTGTLSGGPPYTTITGGITVPIKVVDFEPIATKDVKPYARPTSISGASARDPSTFILDLRKVILTLKVVGKINSDTDGTIPQKVTGLINLIGLGADTKRHSGVITMVAHQDTYNNTDTNDNSLSVNFTKWSVKQNAMSKTYASVTLQLTAGSDSW